MSLIEKRVHLPLELKLKLRDHIAANNTSTRDVVEDILYDFNRGDIVAPRRPESDEVVLTVNVDRDDWQTAVDNARDNGTSMDRVIKTGLERLLG